MGSGSGPVATAFFGEVKERMEEQQQKLMEFQLQEAPQGPQGTPRLRRFDHRIAWHTRTLETSRNVISFTQTE